MAVRPRGRDRQAITRMKHTVDPSLPYKVTNGIVKPSSLNKLEGSSIPFYPLWFCAPSRYSELKAISKVTSVVYKVESTFELFSSYAKLYSHLCYHNGHVSALEKLKKFSGAVTRLCAGHRPDNLPFVRVDAKGLPLKMKFLSEYIYSDNIDHRRLAIFVSQLYQLIELTGSKEDYSTIEKQPTTPIMLEQHLGNYFERVFKNTPGLSLDKDRLVRSYKKVVYSTFPKGGAAKRLHEISSLSKIHRSAKNGPNGPCLATSPFDYLALTLSKDSELLQNIHQMAVITENHGLLNLLELKVAESEVALHDGETLSDLVHSRLRPKYESGARVRLFAICDYMSQSALSGFHDFLMNYMGTWDEDGTFKQDVLKTQIGQWTANINPSPIEQVESCDLSAATDSIPIEVQAEIVEAIAGKDFAVLWQKICSHRTFLGNDGNEYRYLSGQPMGLRSSWPMLAMWNHIMVRTAFYYLREDHSDYKQKYAVLGDDVAILGTPASLVYTELVRDIQGVGISPLKGYHGNSKKFTNDHVAEFAKTIYCNGVQVTPVPPLEISQMLKSPATFAETILSFDRRQICLSVIDVIKLAKLTRKPNWSLVAATKPGIVAPFLVDDYAQWIFSMTGLFWFSPKYLSSADSFKNEIRTLVIDKMTDVYNDVRDTINEWYCVRGVDTPKGYIESPFLSSVFKTVTKELDSRSAQVSKEAYEQLTGSDLDLRALTKLIQKNQVLFELELALKGKRHSRDMDKYIAGNFVQTCVQEVIKHGRIESAYSFEYDEYDEDQVY